MPAEPLLSTPGSAYPRLEQILMASARGEPMRARDEVFAEAGRGLVGDRYHAGTGTFSGRFAVHAGVRELSLIDIAAVDECAQRLARRVSAADLRRNLVVAGLDLAALRGRCLRIGAVRLEVLSDCPPCGYLSRLLGHDMRRGLARIGGMRARVVDGGLLQRRDPIRVEQSNAGGRSRAQSPIR